MLLLALLSSPADAGNPAMVKARRQRREGSLAVGDVAPDPSMVRIDGTPVQLLAARGADRPLVVVFGSFT